MTLAPIALFVYNRPVHTRRVVEALLANELAAESEVLVYSDGPKSAAAAPAVEEVRSYMRQVRGFKSLTLIERPANLGCAQSIITGVTETVNKFGQIIVVEDDILTTPFFLKYMNEALDLYRNDERVACIHGYIYPVKGKLPETFFLRGADIWGWATWKRGWDLFEADSEKLLNELSRQGLTHRFNFDGSFDYTGILENQIAGKLDTWDIRWYASTFLKNKLTLYPGRSLVGNIGIDGSGTHCGTLALFDSPLAEAPVKVRRIATKESRRGRKAFKNYFCPPEDTVLDRFVERIKIKIEKLLGK